MANGAICNSLCETTTLCCLDLLELVQIYFYNVVEFRWKTTYEESNFLQGVLCWCYCYKQAWRTFTGVIPHGFLLNSSIVIFIYSTNSISFGIYFISLV